jgi:hypothetical protein
MLQSMQLLQSSLDASFDFMQAVWESKQVKVCCNKYGPNGDYSTIIFPIHNYWYL